MEITSESVFVSAIRSFCKVFFACIGLFLAFFVGSIVYSIFSSPYAPIEKTTLTLLPDLEDRSELVSFSAPAILQINIDGVVGTPTVLTSETIENILIDSRQGLLSKDRVKGILLRINTPGGGAIDSDNIYRMLKAYKTKHQIPIYAYVDGMCASGGMFIASAADRVYASSPSIVGSVGVISGPYFNFKEVMEKIGIQSKTLTQGLEKDAMNPFRTWKPEEGADLQAIMDAFYTRFVDVVVQARSPRMDRTKLVSEYGAQVFDVKKAEMYGYIDVADAELKGAMADLLSAAKMDPKKPYQVVELSPKAYWLPPIASKISWLGEIGLTLPKEPVCYYYDAAHAK